jgi:hypothetical protein
MCLWSVCRAGWTEGTAGPDRPRRPFAHSAVLAHRRRGVQGCVLQTFQAQWQLRQDTPGLQCVQPSRLVARERLCGAAAPLQGPPHVGADQPQLQGGSLHQLPCYSCFRAAPGAPASVSLPTSLLALALALCLLRFCVSLSCFCVPPGLSSLSFSPAIPFSLSRELSLSRTRSFPPLLAP